MLRFGFLLLLYSVSVNCQINWVSRACIVNRNEYFMEIVQEVIMQIETEFKWCNFKVPDIYLDVNQQLFKLDVQGTVNYTNGFLFHFDHLAVTNIGGGLSSSTVDNNLRVLATVNGVMTFHIMNLGFDVSADLGDKGTHHFTSTYLFNTVNIQMSVSKNILTKETTASAFLSGSSPLGRRMIFVPNNHISQVLSRSFGATLPSNALQQWPVHISRILSEVAPKIDLPEIRFDNRC